MDLQQFLEGLDCRLVLEHDLGRHQGGENSRNWAWKCPLHKEVEGFSLTARLENWHCWGACGTGGNAAKWIQVYHGKDFMEACRILGWGNDGSAHQLPRRRPPEHHAVPMATPPDEAWQAVALEIAQEAKAALWSPAGNQALTYLRQTRGLWLQTIDEAQLGFIPGDCVKGWRRYPLPNGEPIKIPCGITIPWIAEGALWGIKVRRAAGHPKYIMASGGHISKDGLYGADNILPSWPVLFTEGEFDCLVAWQEGMDLLCPVTLGAKDNQLNPRWFAKLATANPLLLNYDADEAGENGAAKLMALSPRFQRIYVPQGKDLNDYHRIGGSYSPVHHWLTELLSGQQERNIA